ncbi:DUF805 domain-containing protein [Leifsonia sp. Root112D2]|uniref:DUF805 domain-containing protein n=1 Tax=Leifsonia sp. Root112D2 TaxID=1736426 RepID=UPI0009EBBF02|nr:DUF805 domain-containing protein [Leifsonia sp. Root112D2]
MSFGQSIQTVFSKYADFHGMARRSEFWWWVLFTSLVSMALSAVPVWGVNMSGGFSTGSLSGLWGIAVLLPSLAVTVRRLRDAAYSWGHIFWLLLPFAGAIVLVVLCAQPTRHIVPGAAGGGETMRTPSVS